MATLREAESDRHNVSGSLGLSQFLNPEAMLTPGVAGALVMMITNSLASNFPLSRAYTGLCLSFVCGLLVLVIDRQWWMRAVYYVINSLIIFCVAFGVNGLGAGVAGASAPRLGLAPISAAYAGGMERSEATSPSREQLDATIRDQQATIRDQQTTIEQLQAVKKEFEPSRPAPVQQNRFFAPWTLK